jgi:hypothetical protein|tara:strand:- start:2801 stop:2992 length:192 start_codon:yes stop_codon:yes gene_type:complete
MLRKLRKHNNKLLEVINDNKDSKPRDNKEHKEIISPHLKTKCGDIYLYSIMFKGETGWKTLMK